ncbi:MAG: single-stranded DNA-binding protein [Bacilli bacterium]|nr:single-stranded DNA-binding protein [Bacilli bacterium]
MNKVLLIGRLTGKPELRYTNSNLPFTRFSVAVNRNFTNNQGQREADFINVIVWRKQAENVCNYLDKGSRVSVEGRIQTGSFDDKDGNKRYTVEVAADSVEFLDTRAESQARTQNQGPTPYDYQGKETNTVDVDSNPFAEYGEEITIDDNFLE